VLGLGHQSVAEGHLDRRAEQGAVIGCLLEAFPQTVERLVQIPAGLEQLGEPHSGCCQPRLFVEGGKEVLARLLRLPGLQEGQGEEVLGLGTLLGEGRSPAELLHGLLVAPHLVESATTEVVGQPHWAVLWDVFLGLSDLFQDGVQLAFLQEAAGDSEVAECLVAALLDELFPGGDGVVEPSELGIGGRCRGQSAQIGGLVGRRERGGPAERGDQVCGLAQGALVVALHHEERCGQQAGGSRVGVHADGFSYVGEGPVEMPTARLHLRQHPKARAEARVNRQSGPGVGFGLGEPDLRLVLRAGWLGGDGVPGPCGQEGSLRGQEVCPGCLVELRGALGPDVRLCQFPLALVTRGDAAQDLGVVRALLPGALVELQGIIVAAEFGQDAGALGRGLEERAQPPGPDSHDDHRNTQRHGGQDGQGRDQAYAPALATVGDEDHLTFPGWPATLHSPRPIKNTPGRVPMPAGTLQRSVPRVRRKMAASGSCGPSAAKCFLASDRRSEKK